jgi:1-acyl-sn-glycerol-3-phosphate acyltransferase
MIRTAIFTLYLVLLILFGGPLLVLYGLIFGADDTYYRVGVDAVLLIVRAVGIRTRVEGCENIPAGTCLFAANHASNIDPPVLVGAIPRRIAVLAKRSLFAIPIMGKAFRMAHYIPVNRGSAESALTSLDLAAGYMKQGTSYLIYPEGTRSQDGRLLPFKRGACMLAIKAGVPVVPIACIGAQHILPKKSLWIRPGEIVVRFCPPIDATEYTLARRGELAERVHAAIAAALPPEQQPRQQPDQHPDTDKREEQQSSQPSHKNHGAQPAKTTPAN